MLLTKLTTLILINQYIILYIDGMSKTTPYIIKFTSKKLLLSQMMGSLLQDSLKNLKIS